MFNLLNGSAVLSQVNAFGSTLNRVNTILSPRLLPSRRDGEILGRSSIVSGVRLQADRHGPAHERVKKSF